MHIGYQVQMECKTSGLKMKWGQLIKRFDYVKDMKNDKNQG